MSEPLVTWNQTVIDGKRYLVVDAKLRIPLDWDPSSNVFLAIAMPTGGVFNYPALVQGQDGLPPDIDEDINFTPLDPDDPTPDFASWTKTGPNLYKLNLGLHFGEKGDDGDTVLDPGDFTGAGPRKILRLNDAGTAFGLFSEKVGDSYLPAVLNSIASGNPAATLGVISIPPQDFDWRPDVTGQCMIDGTGADVAVDLIARLGAVGTSDPGTAEAAGNIVGQGFGRPGITPPTHVLIDGAPAGSGSGYDKVLAGAAAVIYLRAERRLGTQTFTTSATTTSFKAKVRPCP